MSCEKTFCKKYFVPMLVKKLGEMQRAPVTKEKLRKFMTSCKQGYCNPTCKGTIFKNGSFPKNIRGPNGKPISGFFLDMLKKTRKTIFKNKNSVLKNSFYTGLPKKNVSCAKKRGATSGCTLFYLQ